MIKNIILLFSLLIALLFQKLFFNPISLSTVFPDKINAGEEIIAEIKITKGPTSGFAKLQLDIPEGLTVSVVDPKTASFTFSAQKAKFIWVALPADEEFSVSFKIKADPDATGPKNITGQLSYLQNSDKLIAELLPATINVVNSLQVQPPTQLTKLEEPTLPAKEVSNPAPEGVKLTNVSCRRVVEPATVTAGEFIVEVILGKDALTGFAKYQDVLPRGFSATPIETRNASFSFSDQKVKFVWMSIPPQSEFRISYRVKVPRDITGQFFINGEFSYVEIDGETRKCTPPQDAITIIEPEAPIAGIPQTPPPATQEREKPAPTPAQPKPQQEKERKQTPKQAPAKGTIPAPQFAGIQYRVQIEAGPNLVGQDYFLRRYKISENIYTEMHQGLNKYSIGSYEKYAMARDYRVVINTNHPIDTGPFVTAYNNGQRITVQEALMITNQQWVK
jgi:cell division septation protein DedD